MRVAVIGDYNSPEYVNLLQRVKIRFPEERVIDMSLHQERVWMNRLSARKIDMESAHLIIVCTNWESNLDTSRDITEAQAMKKELMIDINGQFIPFDTYYSRK